jgi:hypothetical protein
MFQVDGALHQQEIINKVKEYENNEFWPDGKVENNAWHNLTDVI